MVIHILRGENQIGGNIVELTHGDTRILLDVGQALGEAADAPPPPAARLFGSHGPAAVFVTHYHSDHLGLAYHMDATIPLYLGEAAWRITRACDLYSGRPALVPAGFIQQRKPISVGAITVTPFLCDHSAFDSYMLLCEAGGESVLFTGDFRATGRKSFSHLLAQLPSHVGTLICEGTTLGCPPNAPLTERALETQASTLFSQTQGPVFALLSSANIDRIVTLYRAAKRSGRVFLQELYMADIATAAGGCIPSPAFTDVRPFITGPGRHEGLMKYPNRAGRAGIASMRFVMCVRTSMLGYLQALSQTTSFVGGLLIYSLWSGYRQGEATARFLEGCEALGLRIVTLHTSGHADEAAIRLLIQTTQPATILPIHTENPAWFKSYRP